MAKAVQILLVIGVLSTSACMRSTQSERERRDAANSPAGKVGQAAHKAADEAGKVMKAAGRELGKAAHEAHEGWKEAGRQEKERR
jgi:hypothetical protein